MNRTGVGDRSSPWGSLQRPLSVTWPGMDRTSRGWTASVVPAVRPGSVLVGGHRRQPGVRAPRATGRHHRRRADGGRVGMTRSVNHDRGSVLASGGCLARQGSAPPCRQDQSPPPVATTSCHYKLPPQVATTRGTIGSASVLGRVHSTGQLLRSGSADRPKSGFREPRPSGTLLESI